MRYLYFSFLNQKYATRISVCVIAVDCRWIGRIVTGSSSTFYIFVDDDAAVFTSTRRNCFDDDTRDSTSTTSPCLFRRRRALHWGQSYTAAVATLRVRSSGTLHAVGCRDDVSLVQDAGSADVVDLSGNGKPYAALPRPRVTARLDAAHDAS